MQNYNQDNTYGENNLQKNSNKLNYERFIYLFIYFNDSVEWVFV